MKQPNTIKSNEPGAIVTDAGLARLISAAPAMFDALKNVQRYLERSGEASLLDTFGVNQAIAKAEGKEI